jgi:4-hydroxyproline epimerase
VADDAPKLLVTPPGLHRIDVVDSHTGGEPTRVVIAGGPELGGGTLAQRARIFEREHDFFRSAVVNEPRGSDVVVGALLTEPHDPSCQFGVIFFNNVGILGMCGHGLIGLVVTLAHLGRSAPGPVRIETPVGPVEARLSPEGSVSFDNVPSYRHKKDRVVEVPGYGAVRGDVAWGGNWFFLIGDEQAAVDRANVSALSAYATAVKEALVLSEVTGAESAEIDHIEICGSTPTADSKNFVLCPGLAYDRSPCGTGTSAKLACLAADGQLREGEIWKQESILGSSFLASFTRLDAVRIRPTITGTAFVIAETTQIIHPNDPFAWGIC